MAKTYSAKFGTNPVRLSYANLATPRAQQPGQDPKYSVTLLFPKSDKGGLKKLREVFREVYDNNSSILREYDFEDIFPVRDGAGKKPSGKAYPPEYKDFWVLNTTNKRKPKLQISEDGEVRESMDPATELYSGCWARVGLSIFAYSNNAKTGISAGLDLVRKVRDDEAFSGTVTDSDYFGGDEDNDDDI